MNDSTVSESAGGDAARPGWLRLVAVAAVLGGLIFLTRALPVDEWIESLKSWVDGLGALGPLAYGAAYVVAALLFVPGAAITIGAGAIFGLGMGTAVVSVASTTAAALAFPLARTLLRDRVESMARDRQSFKAIDDAIEDGGWKIVGLLRLSPVVPFSALNYLLGLTKVDYVPAVLVSWITMLPGTLMYVYFGSIGADVAAGRSRGPLEWALLGAGLVATIAVTVMLTRLAKKRMNTETDVEVQS